MRRARCRGACLSHALQAGPWSGVAGARPALHPQGVHLNTDKGLCGLRRGQFSEPDARQELLLHLWLHFMEIDRDVTKMNRVVKPVGAVSKERAQPVSCSPSRDRGSDRASTGGTVRLSLRSGDRSRKPYASTTWQRKHERAVSVLRNC